MRTDNHLPNSEALAERVRADIEGTLLQRFADRLRRVEVYLQDTNAQKGGLDTRCSIEAHLAGYPAVAVDARAGDVDDAVAGAVEKLVSVLETRLGRMDDRGGNVSMSGDAT